MLALFSQLRILLPRDPQYSRPAVAALKELAVKGPTDAGDFRTKLESEEVFDILVKANIVSETMGCAEFQLRALAWYFSIL